jgi:tetratricopeptide (TPR) repeat protein
MTADEPSVPTINVGGNFVQGDISGQSAIGNNISQISYKDCVFYYPDGSTKNGYSWIYTQGARPVIDPKRIFGREKEIENIEDLLKDKSALVITGFRGTGKSTLASMFVDRMEKSGKFAGIYWRKVDETTDIKDIIGSFFTVISKPVKDLERYKIADQIHLLFQELNEASYLLILDNFEILLDPQTNKPLESKVGFSDLIEKVNENCIRSKILFTSWDSFSSERGIRPFSYQIRGLDTSAGIQLLRREGITEPEVELKKAIELSGGHPLALILLAQLVREGAGTLPDLLNDDSLWIGEEGEVAENILNKVYNERLSEDERKLLQYVSIFRQPVPAKAITIVANDPVWTDSRVRKTAWKLCHKSLLLKSDENYWEESLISKYAATQLPEKPEHHKLACKYYRSLHLSVKPIKKEDIQSLIEAHHHACMAKEYDKAFHIIFDNNLVELLDRWGNYSLLIDIYSKMLPEDHFGDEILLENKGEHSIILGNLGNAYSNLGDPRKAIEYYEQALKIDKEMEDRQGEGVWLGNLGLAYRNLGDPRKAIEYLEQALEINPEDASAWLNKGISLYDLDRNEEALEAFEKGLEINPEDENAWFFKGLSLFNLDRYEDALKIFEKALEINSEDTEAWSNKGAALLNLNRNEEALEAFQKTLDINPENADTWYRKGDVLFNLGRYEEALETFEKALEINPEDANAWYYKACAYSLMDKKNEALADLKRAVELDPYYKEWAKSDKDLEKLWEDRNFKEIVTTNKED